MGKNNEAFYLWKRSTRERPVRKRIKFPLLVLGIDVPLVVGFSPHGIWPAQEKKKTKNRKKILRDEKLSGFPRGTVGGYTLLSSIEVRHIL